MRALLVAAVVALAGSPALAGSANIWNGFYAGGSIGGAWGNDTVTNSAPGVDPGPFNFDFGGPVIGRRQATTPSSDPSSLASKATWPISAPRAAGTSLRRVPVNIRISPSATASSAT